jgi:hypothetical protein
MKCPRCEKFVELPSPGGIFYCGEEWNSCYYRDPQHWKEISMPDKPRDPLLVERKKTHGLFKDNAMIAQELKEIMRQPRPGIHPPSLSVHREALDMIALKLSRILSGQANFKDHWDDIAGYAKLGAEACEG